MLGGEFRNFPKAGFPKMVGAEGFEPPTYSV
jgi:hypothetical protein